MDRPSPVTVREQRVAKARRIFGLNKPQRDRGDQADQATAEDHRTTDVSKVLQLLMSLDDSVIRKALQRLHVQWYHCEIERLQRILRGAGLPAKACNLVPQVVQACQVCRPWKKPAQSNKIIYSLAMQFNKEVQFDLVPYHSALEPGLGGVQGIPIAHVIGCCIRWSACIRSSSKSINDSLDCISIAWGNVFGNMQTLTLDGETGMRGKEVDDYATCSQISMKYMPPYQNALLVERHNALIRSALQRAEAQVIKESLCISFNAMPGLVAFMHNSLVLITNHTPYQALPGRRPHLLPALGRGHHGDLNVKGQNAVAGVREIAAVAINEATAKQRLDRGDKRNQFAAIRRSEHQAGDLVDIWYDPPNEDAPGWRGPAQIAVVNEHEGDVIVGFEGKTLYRRHQQVRARVPCLVYSSPVIGHKARQWSIFRREVESLAPSFLTVGVSFHTKMDGT